MYKNNLEWRKLKEPESFWFYREHNYNYDWEKLFVNNIEIKTNQNETQSEFIEQFLQA